MSIVIAGTEINPIGLGCMPMSVNGRPPESQAIEAIHAAIDAGANLLDTADAYCIEENEVGHNERLVAKALSQIDADGVLVATKGGHIRPGGAWELDGSPEHLRAACEASLQALGVEAIDLYQLHRPDPRLPYAESIGALKELRDEGKIRAVGISNASVEQIEEALEIVEIEAVQNQLSLEYPDPVAKGEVGLCSQRGIAFLAWSPLGGISNAADSAGGIDAVAQAAEGHGASPQQVALAWLRSLGKTVVPIPGASRPETARASQASVRLTLSDEELRAISEAAGVG